VAGLHTRGKVYEAQAWNIAKFTDGRFAPRDSDLATGLVGLDQQEEPRGLPNVSPLRKVQPPKPGVPTALVITEEDGCIGDFDPGALEIRAVTTLSASHLRSTDPVAPMVTEFEAHALADTAARLGMEAEETRAGLPSDLANWAERAGVTQIVTGYVPQGPLCDWLDQAMPALQAKGITLCEWQRDWDRLIWPHATAGFFRVKKRIPHLLQDLGMV
jgi:deoxyribodipyrimidine photo-lyase